MTSQYNAMAQRPFDFYMPAFSGFKVCKLSQVYTGPPFVKTMYFGRLGIGECLFLFFMLFYCHL